MGSGESMLRKKHYCKHVEKEKLVINQWGCNFLNPIDFILFQIFFDIINRQFTSFCFNFL
jgi:hypothetical protein